MIPKQLRGEGFRFILIHPKEKIPYEKEWQSKRNYKWNDPIILEHINAGGNLGILLGNGLVAFDCDCQEAENIARMLPPTLVIGTSMKGEFRGKHYYFRCPLNRKLILNDHDIHLGEIQTKGQQCVIPPSIHPSGMAYEVLEDRAIATITEKEIMKLPFVEASRAKSFDLKKGLTEGVTQGNRDDFFVRLATSHRIAGLSQEESSKICRTTNCDPPLADVDILKCVKSAFSVKTPYSFKFDPSPPASTWEKGNLSAINDMESHEKKVPNRFRCGSEEANKKVALDNLMQPHVIGLIVDEIQKTHIGNYLEIGSLLLACLGGLMPAKYRKSIKIGGSSTIGKDNLVTAVLSKFPTDTWIKLTGTSDKYVQRKSEALPPIVYFYELNENQAKGENQNLTGTIKALSEDGITYGVNVQEGQEWTQNELNTSRRTCIYSTTDVGGDDERLNRLLTIIVRGGEPETNDIIMADAQAYGFVKNITDKLDEENEESWVTTAIKQLKIPDAVCIPFLPQIIKYIDKKDLRARRDEKTLRYSISWVAFLNQFQRKWEESNGYKIIVAEPLDLLLALLFTGEFLNQSYEGIEPRLKAAIDKIKVLCEEEEWVLQNKVKRALKMNKKIAWQVFSELDNLNMIERRPSCVDKRAKEIKLCSDNNRFPFLDIAPLSLFRELGGNLSKPIETYLETYFPEVKTV